MNLASCTGNNNFVPKYNIMETTIHFPKAVIEAVPNPLTNTGAFWTSGRGRVSVTVANSAFTFSFEVDGGRSNDREDSRRFWTFVGNTSTPSTNIASVSAPTYTNEQLTFTITTAVPDGGGRTYVFVFSSWMGIANTVQCTSGAAAGNTSITLQWYS